MRTLCNASDTREVNIPTCAEQRAAERRLMVKRLTAQGMSASQIAVRLGVADRTVVRHRAALRAEVAA